MPGPRVGSAVVAEVVLIDVAMQVDSQVSKLSTQQQNVKTEVQVKCTVESEGKQIVMVVKAEQAVIVLCMTALGEGMEMNEMGCTRITVDGCKPHSVDVMVGTPNLSIESGSQPELHGHSASEVAYNMYGMDALTPMDRACLCSNCNAKNYNGDYMLMSSANDLTSGPNSPLVELHNGRKMGGKPEPDSVGDDVNYIDPYACYSHRQAEYESGRQPSPGQIRYSRKTAVLQETDGVRTENMGHFHCCSLQTCAMKKRDPDDDSLSETCVGSAKNGFGTGGDCDGDGMQDNEQSGRRSSEGVTAHDCKVPREEKDKCRSTGTGGQHGCDKSCCVIGPDDEMGVLNEPSGKSDEHDSDSATAVGLALPGKPMSMGQSPVGENAGGAQVGAGQKAGPCDHVCKGCEALMAGGPVDSCHDSNDERVPVTGHGPDDLIDSQVKHDVGCSHNDCVHADVPHQSMVNSYPGSEHVHSMMKHDKVHGDDVDDYCPQPMAHHDPQRMVERSKR